MLSRCRFRFPCPPKDPRKHATRRRQSRYGTECMTLISISRSNLLPRRRRAAGVPREARPPIEVSVCIVNWSCHEYLRACLRSLLERPQGVSLEVIVVDNASQDGAAEMTAREFPEVVLIRNSINRGYAQAGNQAAQIARGRYL